MAQHVAFRVPSQPVRQIKLIGHSSIVAAWYSGLMLTDLVQIRRLGEKQRDENERFRKYLKRHDFVERRFRIIGQQIEDQIDCTQCANCCREATVRLAERDVLKLAKFLRIKPAQFLRDYTLESEEEGVVLRRTETGCVFLDGNLCSIYESRPHNCEN